MIILIGLNACFSSYAAKTDQWDRRDRDEITYRKLEYYRQIYAKEIFDYCSEKYDKSLSNLKKCLSRQAILKRNTLKLAQDQFGMRSLAQFIYDECLARNSAMGVDLIAACVNTRIALNVRIGDLAIEDVIFQNCDVKWLRHGYRAVHNCCLNAANYYRRFGEIKQN